MQKSPKKGGGASRVASLFLLMMTLLVFFTIGTITKPAVQEGDKKNTLQKTTKKRGKDNKEKVHIFYNLFTNSSEDEERVRKIVEEQFALVDPTIHEPNVTITSIGHQLPLAGASLGNATYHIGQHYTKGDEYLTLHALWKYCKSKSNNNQENNARWYICIPRDHSIQVTTMIDYATF